jgi:Fe-S-cluster-containing hydrogenase component 2
MKQMIYLKDVVTLKLDQKKYMGCGMCLLVCPHVVFSLTNDKIEITN